MLFIKELRKICFSFVYVLFLGLLLFSWHNSFYGVTEKEISAARGEESSVYTEIAGGSVLKKPQKNAGSYGSRKKEVPEKIMCGGTDILIIEYLKNSYATYPFNYYKEVVLSEEEQSEILSIIEEITGLTEEEINHLPDDYFPAVNGNIIHFENSDVQYEDGSFTFEGEDNNTPEDTDDDTKHFISQVSYERFKELMSEAESIIGAGSNYSMDMLTEYYGQVEMTYDEALEEYNKTINDDKVSGAFARLFCDYMTRALGLYPVFIAAAFWLKDRHSRMHELINSRQMKTEKLILARFSAILTAVMIPVVLLSFESLIPLLRYSADTGIAIDVFAFIKYILWWLLPVASIVTALGTFLTILTSTPLAVLVQFVWWFVDSAVTGLTGDTKWYTLMIRHNLLSGSEIIRQNLIVIWLNRGLFMLMSVLLLWLSVIVYEKKRGGKLEYEYTMQRHWRILKNRFPACLQK